MTTQDNYDHLSDFFKVMIDPLRLAIVDFLKSGEQSFKIIRDHLDRSPSIISNALKILTDADLLKSRSEGTNKYFSIKNHQIYGILNTVENFLKIQRQNKLLELSKAESDELIK
jgi:DNA-binding transcriptional ArsR family regulator